MQLTPRYGVCPVYYREKEKHSKSWTMNDLQDVIHTKCFTNSFVVVYRFSKTNFMHLFRKA